MFRSYGLNIRCNCCYSFEDIEVADLIRLYKEVTGFIRLEIVVIVLIRLKMDVTGFIRLEILVNALIRLEIEESGFIRLENILQFSTSLARLF